jgi:hypothetical protein
LEEVTVLKLGEAVSGTILSDGLSVRIEGACVVGWNVGLMLLTVGTLVGIILGRKVGRLEGVEVGTVFLDTYNLRSIAVE